MASELHVLIVEDDESLRASVARYLEDKGFATTTAASTEEAEQALADGRFHAALVDYRLPGRNGIEFIRGAKRSHPELACILVTAFGDVQSAVEAMKAGAVHFLEKPVDPQDLLATVRKACEKEALRAEVDRLRREVNQRYGFEHIVGTSAGIQQVFERIRLAAPTNSTILLTGETGTGKELVARAIHTASARSAKPFVVVNCAALPETLVESELFGYEKGAFTGATSPRVGFFEAAAGGTLFVDEVGEMPLGLQAKLLRALEQRVITRVGSTTELPVDVRILAATNVPLDEAVRDGTFRRDLYFRLNVLQIALPPLRDRRGDVPLLVAEFLGQLNEEHGRNVTDVTPEALDALQRYPWPGNVRELRNMLESIIVLSTKTSIGIEDLPGHVRRGDGAAPLIDSRAPAPADDHAGAGHTVRIAGKTFDEIEREVILAAVEAHDGNRTQAARALGISVRTIQRKLAEYAER